MLVVALRHSFSVPLSSLRTPPTSPLALQHLRAFIDSTVAGGRGLGDVIFEPAIALEIMMTELPRDIVRAFGIV